MKNNNKHSGYSLLELLISMSLGVFVIGGTLSFFEVSKNTQSIQSELSDVRENAKFALDMIKDDIQLAGFYGCATRWADSSLVNTLAAPQDDFKWNFSQAVYGTEYSYDGGATPPDSWNPALDLTIENDNIYRGDTITLRHADRREFDIVSHNSATASVKITSGNKLKQYDYLLATDCEHSSIFQKTNSTAGSLSITHSTSALESKYAGNATSDLGKQFSNEAKVMKLLSVTYFIAKTSGNIPALYRTESAKSTEEVITGITDLQIEYGVDTNSDGSIDAYHKADEVQDNDWWESVLIVRLTIKAQGYKDVISSGDEKSAFSNGTNMEYEVSAAINLRNRMP